MKTRLFLFLSLICLTLAVYAEDFRGKCIGVTDGDTISVMHNGKAEKIRLDGIDCPESAQAWGTQAKKATSSLVFGKDVYVFDKGKEKYGRTLGIVINPDNWNVNQTLVRNGFAWHYKQYSKDPELAKLEELARKEKKGLWQDPNPLPPWEFRRNPQGAAQAGGTQATPLALSAAQATSASQNQFETVYATSSGTKYHRAGCRYLAKSSIPLPLSQAALKYQPCSVCNPPRLQTASSASAVPPAVPPQTAVATPATAQAFANTASVQNQSETVYVTSSGTKYHRAGCRYLAKSSIPLPLSQAALRYSPCSVCNPPRLQSGGASIGQSTTSVAPQVSASAPLQPTTISPSYSGTPTGGTTAKGYQIYTGPRGGRYHISKSGKKVYERRR